jgi:hypothetical protein
MATHAEQMLKAIKTGNDKKYDRLRKEAVRNSDNNFSYEVFADGSVYEDNQCMTYTADDIIHAAPDCLFHSNNEEDPLQRWLLDAVCDIVGKPRVTVAWVSA